MPSLTLLCIPRRWAATDGAAAAAVGGTSGLAARGRVEGGVASGDGGRPPPRRRRPRGFGEFAVGGVVGGDGEFGDELPLDAYLLSTTENNKSDFETSVFSVFLYFFLGLF
jgi:hypothetical protein